MDRKNKYADAFREMADKIERNEESDIAGVFLVVPPLGDAVSGILVGEQDLGGFFGLLKNKLDMAVTKLDYEEKKRLQGIR